MERSLGLEKRQCVRVAIMCFAVGIVAMEARANGFPEVDSIVRGGSSPTNAASVEFDVTLDESVTGVDVTDFQLTTTGSAAGSISGVSGSGTSYTVTVNTLTGVGTLRLDFIDDDSVINGSSDPVGGAGATNGNFTSGEVYTIDRSSPDVQTVSVSSGSTVDVTFSEAVSAAAATATNYTVSGTGKGTLADHPDSVASLGGNAYQLTWNAGEMFDGGNITITVTTVTDTIGNTLGSNGGAHNSGAIGTAPDVDTVEVHSGTTVDVTFTEAMDSAVTTASNYTVSGTGKGSLSDHPDDVDLVSGNIYRLTWNAGEMFNGGDITITVANLTDEAENELDDDAATDSHAATGTLPTGTIAPSASSTTFTHTSFVVQFSEAVTGFSASGDVTVATLGGLSYASVVITPASTTEYSVQVNGLSGVGTLTLSVNSSAAQDAAGNLNTAFGPSSAVSRTEPATGGGGGGGVVDPETPVDTSSGTTDDDGSVDVEKDGVSGKVEGFEPETPVKIEKEEGVDKVVLTVGDTSAPKLVIDVENVGESGTVTVNKSSDNTYTTELKVASDVYNFEFGNADHSEVIFTKPVTIKLPIADTSNVDTDLLTLAKIINGKLEYYGGKYNTAGKYFESSRKSFALASGAEVPVSTMRLTTEGVPSGVTVVSREYGADTDPAFAATLRLHRYDEASGTFTPAGTTDRGVMAATRMPGDYGVDLDTGYTWAVVDANGEFGNLVPTPPASEPDPPAPVDDGSDDDADNDSDGDDVAGENPPGDTNTPPPAVPNCGWGAVTALTGSLIGLTLLPKRRRRIA